MKILADFVAEIDRVTNGGTVELLPSKTFGLIIRVKWFKGNDRMMYSYTLNSQEIELMNDHAVKFIFSKIIDIVRSEIDK